MNTTVCRLTASTLYTNLLVLNTNIVIIQESVWLLLVQRHCCLPKQIVRLYLDYLFADGTCNCDAGYNEELSDIGIVTDKSRLPVTRLRLSGQSVVPVVGHLICRPSNFS